MLQVASSACRAGGNGAHKSAVSERFVYGTERKLAELMSRDRRQVHVVALLIDGMHFGEHAVLAAVGVDAQGAKHVLGLREGATENATAVRNLPGAGFRAGSRMCWRKRSPSCSAGASRSAERRWTPRRQQSSGIAIRGGAA